MLGSHRKAVALAIAIMAASLAAPAASERSTAAALTCATDFEYDVPGYGDDYCVLEFECGETAPDHGCYRCVNSGQWLMFDCTQWPGSPHVGGCDATGCRVT